MRTILALRAQVDANALKSPIDSTKVISPAAAAAIDVVGSASRSSTTPSLSRRIFALYATIQFNQTALVQRGAGEAALKEASCRRTAS